MSQDFNCHPISPLDFRRVSNILAAPLGEKVSRFGTVYKPESWEYHLDFFVEQ